MRKTASSTVAIGTATLFVALAAILSFLAEEKSAFGGGWSLRGTIVPSAKADER